jgi:hypothetical protein
MSDDALKSAANCPSCGASRRADARYCWLCGAELPSLAATKPAKEAKDDIVLAEAVELSATDQRLLVWLAVIVVALIGFGVAYAQDSFVALLYAVAVVPTLLVILIGTTRARASGAPWSPAKTTTVAITTALGTLLTTIAVVVVTLAVMVLVLLAMAIALIQQCFAALGGGG